MAHLYKRSEASPRPADTGACHGDLRLLIGNTTNRETLEQITGGYRRLEMVADAAEETREQINVLERAFRAPLTTALKCDLNLLRRNSVAGQELLGRLIEMYLQHNLRDWIERRPWQTEDAPIPKIVCSEGLV